MKKIIALAFLSVAAITVKAQDNPETVEVRTLAQTLRTQATISPAWSVTLLSGNDSIESIGGGRTNVYLHGTAEYYVDERFSIRGDIYLLLNKSGELGGVRHNHGIQVGTSYHFIKGSNIDPFIGLRAGLNYTQTQLRSEAYPVNPTYTATIAYQPDAHLDPTWAPVIGCNFYGQKFFHFFIEGAWMQGTYRPTQGSQLSLEEFRVSAGLGLNFSFFKPVDTVRKKI